MKLWAIILGIWLVLVGLDSVAQLSFRYEELVRGGLAILAGILVFVQK